MKVVLVCPSNMLYMPYVDNYKNILDEINVDYEIINWDRFGIEEVGKLRYRDSKIGHQRNFYDYYKYSKFILKILKENKYSKVIIFGLQLTFFMNNYLKKWYKGNYIVDIRDYNKIINFFNIEKIINLSEFTVLSSPGYKKWLPKSSKYIINHNTKVEDSSQLVDFSVKFDKDTISIGCIGAIRDYQINIEFINSVMNNNDFLLNYHGNGDCNKNIEAHLIDYDIKNVRLTGRYFKEDEPSLYQNNNLINVLRFADGVNNETALPNRLYNAAFYDKPMIAYKGSYLAEVIEKYHLGLVLDSFNNVDDKIYNYIDNFNFKHYKEYRKIFFDNVVKDNLKFKQKIIEFLNS
ncbi:hypothetical protein [Anaerocolumna aminovalerica]|uniref:hypothetical protein n=1 Tax=Anaerocolumna aminovalerica TaxID=1527 RepID=UPI000BE3D968|nr:hypothetical protein [Anaerocolumna aminovalerica]